MWRCTSAHTCTAQRFRLDGGEVPQQSPARAAGPPWPRRPLRLPPPPCGYMVGVRVGLIHHQRNISRRGDNAGPLVLLLALLPDLLPVLAPVLAPSQVVRCTWVCIARICVYASRMHTLRCMCMLCAEVCYLYAACVCTTSAHRTCALCRAQAAHANPRLQQMPAPTSDGNQLVPTAGPSVMPPRE